MSSKVSVAVIGSGVVAQTLAAGFIRHGYPVTMGTRDATKLADWLTKQPQPVRVSSMAEAAQACQVVVLAVKGSAAEEVVGLIGPEHLAGKVVIDPTNPIAAAPPDNGVLRFFTDINLSLMERLQALAPKAHFVKAFSCVGSPFMVNPQFPGGAPTMFICGNEATAKQAVTGMLRDFDWDVADMGGAEAARAIEPLCMLWCIPGMLHNEWTHAFKLLKLA